MSKSKSENIDLRNQIYRTVASSTAIETGESICELEKKLKNNDSKFNWITLA